MILNPEIQRKGREEIQQVLGSGRLPKFEDRDLLPYVNAIVKELFRWHPAVPLGGAHLLEEDVMMDGYFLKKGSIMFGNIW
jgi:cytochrome P450